MTTCLPAEYVDFTAIRTVGGIMTLFSPTCFGTIPIRFSLETVYTTPIISGILIRLGAGAHQA